MRKYDTSIPNLMYLFSGEYQPQARSSHAVNDVLRFVHAQDAASGSMHRRVLSVMLDAIAQGELKAGEMIRDHEWAEAFIASRTPVREAVQQLEGMGLLEVSPARYTRLRSYTSGDAVVEVNDWITLHQALIAVVAGYPPNGLIGRLGDIRSQPSAYEEEDRARRTNFDFFDAVRSAIPNSAIVLGAKAAAYRLRLAEPALEGRVGDYSALHDAVIHSLSCRDRSGAYRAFEDWSPMVFA